MLLRNFKVCALAAAATVALTGAIASFRKAVAIQDAMAYMELPYWYYPVRQSLGAALLAAGKTDQVEQVFRKSLVNCPNNGWRCTV